MIHHTVSFSPVINIVIGWTLKLPGGRERGSPLGGSGSSTSHRHGDQRVFRSDSPQHVSSAWRPVPVPLRSPLVLNELTHPHPGLREVTSADQERQ